MKVLVKAPFFDAKGIHKQGEVYETDKFQPEYMELIENETKAKAEKVEKAVKADPKKTTRKKV